MNEGFAATVAVPAWATFMKRATAGHKPDWIHVPVGVEKVTLCRLSGQLATDECRWTMEEIVPASDLIVGGLDSPTPPPPQPVLVPVQRPEAVYEEYVLKGTVGRCPLHQPQTLADRPAIGF